MVIQPEGSMWRAHFLLFAFFSAVARLPAQQEDLDIDRLEIPAPPPETPVPYFGLGGGFVGTFLFPKLDALNTKSQQWDVGTFSQPLFMSGVEGVVTVGLIPNLRISVFGLGGSKELQKSLSADTQRRAGFALSATGLSIAYAIVPARSLTIVPTVSSGWGMLNVEFAQAPTHTRWETVSPNSEGPLLHRLTASYLFVHPQLYAEYAPLPFLMIRLGGGYQFSFLGQWEHNRIAVAEGVPAELNASGASAQFAIFVGLFN
ncbi:MAG: hypothetical protein NZ473_05275 [Candidatus Kapabacteria bacterium]|nr:hypothetical protein [Candidatus Kapabacteria bacterium]MDW8225150.1 hypothetical protein [Bacteroidota bacterium]